MTNHLGLQPGLCIYSLMSSAFSISLAQIFNILTITRYCVWSYRYLSFVVNAHIFRTDTCHVRSFASVLQQSCLRIFHDMIFPLGSNDHGGGRVHLSFTCQLLVHQQYLVVLYQSPDVYCG